MATLLVILSTLLASGAHATEGTPCRPGYSGERGVLQGQVTDSETGTPIGDLVVNLLEGTSILACGSTTDAEGEFELSVPPGRYWLKLAHPAYRTIRTDSFTLAPGETVQMSIEAAVRGLSARAAAAESLGVDLDPQSLRLTMEITPDRDRYRPGDEVGLQIEIRNRSTEPVYLPGILDDSIGGRRHPRLEIEVTGPAGRVAPTLPLVRCGFINPLRARDLHRVEPDSSFVLRGYGNGALRLSGFGMQLEEPGSYRLTLRFLMRQTDLRQWWGPDNPGPVQPELSRILRRVPMVDLVATCEIVVE